MLVFISLTLIFNFLRRLFFTEGGELPSPTVNFLTITTELAMLVGVVGLSVGRLKATTRVSEAIGAWLVLPVLGTLAGLSLLVIRMNGEHEWGRRARSTASARVSSQPRAPQPPEKQGEERSAPQIFQPTLAKPTPDLQQAERDRVKAELRSVHASFKTQWDKLLQTRWAETVSEDPREGNYCSFATVTAGSARQLRKLRREDLLEFRGAQRALLDCYEKAFDLFQEAQKNFDPFNPGVDLGGWYRSPERWRAAQQTHLIAYAQSELLEQNWDEWRRLGVPAKGKLKPWQNKARQLHGEFNSALIAMLKL